MKDLTICLIALIGILFIGLYQAAGKSVVAERHIAAQQAYIFELENQVHLVRITAYCPCEKCCGRFADGVTASGHRIQPGDKFVAAPKEIPFGTILDVPGYGRVPVLDRGGAIKVNRLDVFFSSHQAALDWGVKYLKVKICERMAKGKE